MPVLLMCCSIADSSSVAGKVLSRNQVLTLVPSSTWNDHCLILNTLIWMLNFDSVLLRSSCICSLRGCPSVLLLNKKIMHVLILLSWSHNILAVLKWNPFSIAWNCSLLPTQTISAWIRLRSWPLKHHALRVRTWVTFWKAGMFHVRIWSDMLMRILLLN